MEEQTILSEQTTSMTNTLRLVEGSEAVKSGQALCTLRGPFADCKIPTRNNRKYITRLWKRIIASSHVLEMLDTKTFFGEADHPTAKEERLEVSLPKVSHNITKIWLDESDEVVYGELDILDTPAGRILKTLIDYGSILGISSRGAGRVIKEGNENIVDPDTYNFVTFDIVPLPANVASRLKETTVGGVVDSAKGMLNAIGEQVKSLLDKNDHSELNAVRSVLESINIPELEPLCEQVNHALNDTSIDESVETALEEAYRTISTLRTQVGDLEDKVRIFESEKANKAANTITLPNESILENLDKNFTLMMNRFDQLDEQISTTGATEDDMKKVQDELAEATLQVSQLTKSVELLEEKLEVTKNELETSHRQSAELNSKLNQNESLISELEAQVLELTEANQTLVQDKEELSEQVTELNGQLQEATAQVDELSEQINIVTDQAENSLNELDNFSESVNQLKSDAQSRESLIESLESQVAGLQSFVGAYVELRAKQRGVNYQLAMKALPESFNPEIVEKTLNELAITRVNQEKVAYSNRTNLASTEATALTENTQVSAKHNTLVNIVQGVRHK